MRRNRRLRSGIQPKERVWIKRDRNGAKVGDEPQKIVERRIAELRAKAIAGLAVLEAGRVSELSADDIKRIARERFLR